MVSNTCSSLPGELEMMRSTSEVAVCCSSASASSRVRPSSCFFNSISELGSSLTCALAFVPVERSLRPRVGLFAPLRDKVTSSAQSLAPPPGRPSQGSSLSILTEPRDELASPHSITSSARASSGGGGEADDLCRRQVDHQLQFRRKFNRQIARFRSLQNFVHESRRSPPAFAHVNAVAHQSAVLDNLPLTEHGWQPGSHRQ